MPVYYVEERPADRFFERQLPNGSYRYEGYHNTIKYCIDSKAKKSKDEIKDFLDSCSIDYLIDKEGYIINLR
ncbi:hypothetical protein LS684_04305 [Cytobacillus spongiae]|uniref:hypothetical protein n=1 Tax=Cytobacillus spongiae TaxID=2901381 RepID=UPI001F290A55|nr:hypothetical protein [Cytobacillus spongiae]UII56693.1 hypothetical protein LS684_04305 [Cytobacillus spongiae]